MRPREARTHETKQMCWSSKDLRSREVLRIRRSGRSRQPTLLWCTVHALLGRSASWRHAFNNVEQGACLN